MGNEYMSPLGGKAWMENGRAVNIANSYANKTTGFERVQVVQTVKTLLPSAYNNAVKAVMTVEGGDIRCRTDGTAPTFGTGLLIRAGSSIVLEGTYEITNFKALSIVGTSILNIEYKG